MTEQNDYRAALRQFIATDRFFGLDQVPISQETLAAIPPAGNRLRPRPAADSACRQKALDVLDRDQVRECRRCGLHETRTNTVFGVGSSEARLVFVGEGPGYDEDQQGIPFVGRAGQLLTRMIVAMGLKRADVYICNIVKCRPPQNRDPASDEIVSCSPYLFEQLRIIDPEVIIALGAPAAKTLLNTTQGIGRLRGKFHDFHLRQADGTTTIIPLMPTYHPAYLLRSPGEKGKAWEDLQQVMARLGLPLPQRR